MSTDVSEVRAASIIALMLEAACTSEMSVDIYLTTWQYIPEDSELYIRRHENLKSHKNQSLFTLMDLISHTRFNVFEAIISFESCQYMVK
jgi:hypothetical protein